MDLKILTEFGIKPNLCSFKLSVGCEVYFPLDSKHYKKKKKFKKKRKKKKEKQKQKTKGDHNNQQYSVEMTISSLNFVINI